MFQPKKIYIYISLIGCMALEAVVIIDHHLQD